MEKQLFISHSSKDRDYGEALVKLLRRIGLKSSQIIFTSNPDYGIPVGADIFGYLKTAIYNNAHMLYLLSDHYYNSVACMNEMGAAWVMQNTFHILTVPGFDPQNDKLQGGAINPKTMLAGMDDPKRIRQLAAAIQKEFSLCLPEAELDDRLAEYLQEVQKITEKYQNSTEYKLKIISQKIARNPQNDDLYRQRAKLLFDRKDLWAEKHPEIVRDCLHAAFLNPENKEAFYLLLQIAANYKEYFGTELLADFLCEHYPNDSGVYACRGYVNCEKNRYDQSIEDCSHAISISTGKINRWYYNTRGRCYLKLGKYDDALADFRTAHELDPSYQPAITNLKITAERMGSAALLERGTNARSHRNLEEARFYYDLLCRIEPENEDFLTECGGICYDMGDGKQAFHYWQKLLQQSKSSKSYFLCGNALLMQGKTEEAEPYFPAALQYPDTPIYYDLIQAILNKYYS